VCVGHAGQTERMTLDERLMDDDMASARVLEPVRGARRTRVSVWGRLAEERRKVSG
jgi:hypothetical protein